MSGAPGPDADPAVRRRPCADAHRPFQPQIQVEGVYILLGAEWESVEVRLPIEDLLG